MGTRIQLYRASLREVADLGAYLAEHSGLPGPRGNIELAQAAAEELDVATLERLAGSGDEFEAFCGVVGLGRAIADGLPAFDRWRRSADPEVGWVVRANLRRSRLRRVLTDAAGGG